MRFKMPDIIRNYDNKNQPLVDADNEILSLTYFNLIKLSKAQEFTNKLDGFESVYVVMTGNCDIEVNGQLFENVGQRKDIFSGQADSVYIPANASVKVKANADGTEIAIAGGKCDTEYEPFRVKPEEVEMVDVGSLETHSRRRIYHVLGHNAQGRAGNLLVSELYCDGGCWCGYPPHKHDEDIKNDKGQFDETAFEELYHYRYNPQTGFGAQFVFSENEPTIYMVRNGDTLVIDKGYHPNATSPGHLEYIFTVLVGHTQRSLIQNFKQEHRHLMDTIPGIKSMRDKFK